MLGFKFPVDTPLSGFWENEKRYKDLKLINTIKIPSYKDIQLTRKF